MIGPRGGRAGLSYNLERAFRAARARGEIRAAPVTLLAGCFLRIAEGIRDVRRFSRRSPEDLVEEMTGVLLSELLTMKAG